MVFMALVTMLVTLYMGGFNMKKDNIIEIVKISCFFFFFIIMYFLLTFIMKPFSVDLINIAGFYGEKDKSMDMVYIGGSAGFVYWEPIKAWEDKGITSYNFAADTIQAELYQYLVKETLKHQDPKVIIIDARAFQYRDVDQPPTEVAYRNVLTGTPLSWDRFNFIQNNVPKYLKDDTLSYHIDLIKYHGAGRTTPLKTSLQIMSGKYQNDIKGFYFLPQVASLTKTEFNTDKVTPLSRTTNKILDDLLKYLKTTGYKVLFVVSPYTELQSHKENFNYVEQQVTSAGFDFLDTNEYYDEMDLRFETDFINYAHVNIFGADKYTTFLENYLVNKYNLPNRSFQKQYADDWNPLLGNWHSQVDATKTTINTLLGRDADYGIYIK